MNLSHQGSRNQSDSYMSIHIYQSIREMTPSSNFAGLIQNIYNYFNVYRLDSLFYDKIGLATIVPIIKFLMILFLV